MHMQTPARRIATISIALLMLAMACCSVAVSAATAKVSATSAGIYESTSAKKPAAQLKKGTSVTVLKEGSAWLMVRYSGKTGYMKKSAMQKVAAPRATSKLLKLGSSGTAVKKLQARLVTKGYLSKSGVTGKYGSGTRTAVRIFQMFNSLSINGTANASTQKKLFSSSARAKPKISIEPWGQSGIDSRFPFRSTAVIIDVQTGVRINIRRLYGSNHCDVEPKAKADTVRLKAIYGGKWSWDSRGVVLIAGGKCYAAAINSMPHGGQLSTSNGYPGQFCLHLKDSKTHGTNRENADHQANIAKVYSYFN